jgi:hypothetical protein
VESSSERDNEPPGTIESWETIKLLKNLVTSRAVFNSMELRCVCGELHILMDCLKV